MFRTVVVMPVMTQAHRFVLAALALLPAAPALMAQTQAAPTQRIEVVAATSAASSLDEAVAGASRLHLTPRQQPASVTLVDTQAIEAMGAQSTQDILGAVAGISWSAQPGSPGSVFYRGFGSGSLTQLWNGLSVQYDAIAARPVDAWSVAAVEVIGGASGFLYGTGGVGGTINIVTKVADAGGDFTHLRAAAGTTSRLALDLQRRLGAPSSEDGGDGGHALRLVANATQGTHAASGDGRRSAQLAASWRLPLASTLTHLLALERQWEQVDQPYWGTPLQRDAAGAILGRIAIDPATVGVNYNVVDGLYRQDVTWLRSVLRWQPSPAAVFTHTLYHYDAQRDYENVETYAFVDANTRVVRGNALLQRHDQQLYGSRGEFSFKGRLGALASDSALGWDWSFNRQTRFPLSVAGPFDRTDPYAPAATYFLATPGITRSYTPGATNRLHTGALFAENRTVLGAGLALVSALRADRITLQVVNHRSPTASNPARFHIAYHPITGRIGLVKDLSPAWQLYAQYSTAADPPAGALATANYAALRDFDLTRGRQFEIGSKASFDQGRGQWRVALYDIVRRNIAMPDPDDRTRVIAVGQQSSQGVELAMQWAPTPAWTLAGHLSLTRAHYDAFTETVGGVVVSRAGQRPPNTPAQVAGVQADWRPAAQWTLSAQWRHVGRRYANSANSAWDEAYDLFSAGLSWRPDPRLTLRAQVFNLADTVYAATVGASSQAYLGAPRTVAISADWRF